MKMFQGLSRSQKRIWEPYKSLIEPRKMLWMWRKERHIFNVNILRMMMEISLKEKYKNKQYSYRNREVNRKFKGSSHGDFRSNMRMKKKKIIFCWDMLIIHNKVSFHISFRHEELHRFKEIFYENWNNNFSLAKNIFGGPWKIPQPAQRKEKKFSRWIKKAWSSPLCFGDDVHSFLS